MEVNKIVELSEFLKEKGMRFAFIDNSWKPQIYCNGFSISYRNGLFKVDSNNKKLPDRDFTNEDDVFQYITNKFFETTYRQLKPIMDCFLVNSGYNGERTVMDCRYAVSKIKNHFELKGHYVDKIERLILENRLENKTNLALMIYNKLDIGNKFINYRQALMDIRKKIPELPKDIDITLPVNKNELLNNQITIRDLVILCSFLKYPSLFKKCWDRKARRDIIGVKQSLGNLSACVMNEFNLPCDWWEQLNPYKDTIYNNLMGYFIEHDKFIAGATPNQRIMWELAMGYGISIPEQSKVKLSPIFIKSLVRNFKQLMLNEYDDRANN